MFRAPCSHRQEVKIVLYTLWYHHTETREWSKITKITNITEIYKYAHIVVKFYYGMSSLIGWNVCADSWSEGYSLATVATLVTF